ncbi:MAG: uroporphyrinogen-III C-methyltransferase, partial [Halothiobacillaceae bacterium]|nr:uroporphyrinogen-III C-methyltransferase [Halothiobacillaceae bacterium]
MTQPLKPEPSAPEDQPASDPVMGRAAAESAAEPERPIPPSRVYAYWLLTFFVIFTGSLVSLSWVGFKLFQTNAERINSVLADQRAEQATFSQSLITAQNGLSQTQAEIKSERETFSQLSAEQKASQHALAQQIGQVENKIAGIQDRLGQGEIAWQWADIGFILTRAQERLSIANDPAGAAIALKLADEHIARLALPQMLPVRAAISTALTQLVPAAALDRVGVALSLQRAAAQLGDWPLALSESQSVASAPNSNPSGQASGQAHPQESATQAPWYIRWPNAAWQPVADWFARQFTFTRSNEPVKTSARAATDRETLTWLTAVREALLARDTPSL